MKDRFKPWNYKGTAYMAGIGTMHAEQGFPMVCSLVECANHGVVPCLEEAAHELFRASSATMRQCKETVLREVREMIVDPPESWTPMIDRLRAAVEEPDNA